MTDLELASALVAGRRRRDEARALATDPTLSQAERIRWRKVARAAGGRLGRLVRELRRRRNRALASRMQGALESGSVN